MPTNPPAPQETKPRTQRVVASVNRFANRHTEVVTFASGIALGAAVSLLARLVP